MEIKSEPNAFTEDNSSTTNFSDDNEDGNTFTEAQSEPDSEAIDEMLIDGMQCKFVSIEK